MVMTQGAMAGQRFTLGPGKTAPRLIEDLLDYDLTSKLSKNGKNILADPAPQHRPEAIAPLRTGPNDCRHALMWKNVGKEGLAAAPRSADERPDIHSKYNVESYCSKCRYHFQIKVSFESLQEDGVICHLSDADSPMHHLRLVGSMKGKDWEESIGIEAFKYDPLVESHGFVCTALKCPAMVEIRISPPRLPLKLLAPITDKAKLYQRGQAQIKEEPERYAGHSPVSVYAALGFFRTYLHDARNIVNAEEVKRIAKRNKKYMLAFGNECEPLFEYVGFKSIEGDVDPELGPSYFWQLPVVTDQNRNFINDVITELELHIRRHEPERTLLQPVPALKDIERSLGYYDYPTRKRTIDLESVEHPYYASLGACENFTDELLSWAYDRQRECDPENRPYYLDCLKDLANGRQSPDLQMKVVLAESAGELGLQAIRDAYKFFALDPNTVEGDDHIIGQYRSRIESAPRQKDEARQCLLVIARQRDSAQIEAVANDRTMTFEEALEFLNVSADTASDSIEASAVAMSLDADKSRVAGALRVIANKRGSDFTLQRAAAFMESGSGGSTLDIGEAYKRLQIHQRNIPDETVLMYYKNLVGPGVAAGSKDSYSEALRIIALDRQSNYLLQKLENPDAMVEATPAEPVGIDNIGNTCYLNSLLQYYYTIKPVRDMVIDFQDYRMILNEENLRKKRAGGRIIEKAEIIKSQKFVDELHDLFEKLKTSSTRSVRPTKELAELTIFSTEKEETFRRKSISSPHGPPTISSVLEGAVYGPQWPPPPTEAPPTPEDDIEMVDRPMDKTTDAGDDSSEATLIDMDQLPPLVPANSIKNSAFTEVEGFTDGASDDKMTLDKISAESTEDLVGDAVMVNGHDSPIESEKVIPPQEKPPPIPPRNKSGLVISTNESKPIIVDNDFWRFGVQQDVTEIIDNVIFRLQCAIKPTSIEASSGERIDIITHTFYGANTTYTQKAQSLDSKTEAWSHLMAFPGVNIIRDVYEAIDIGFDVRTVEVENSTCPQYTSISTLPPILQFQVQRTDWNQQMGSFKNRTHVMFPETIYLDRYVDTGDQNSMVMRRRRETWKWKAQLRTLEARESALKNSKGEIPVEEALNSVKEYIKSLQEEEIEGIEIDPALPEALEERISEVNDELKDLAEQIESLRQKLRDQFTDLTQYEYKLHSVFIHRGEAGGGHYWVYIYDFEQDVWREYNDENVTIVRDRRRIFDDQGAAGNPYFVAYVRSQDKTDLVDAVCREIQEVPVDFPPRDINEWAGGVEYAVQDNDGFEQLPETSHLEHVSPRPLRPKPTPGGSKWEENWPPASDGLKDADSYGWN